MTQGHRAEQQALLATARGLSAQADSLQQSQPDLALLLAVEAQKLRDSPETRSGLLTVLSASPHLARIAQGFGNDIFDFALSPDGRTAAVAHSDGSFQVFDFASEKPLTPSIRVDNNPVEVRWINPRILVTAWNDGMFRLWEARTGRSLHTATVKLDPGIHDFALSPGGSMIAVADQHDNVRIFRTSDLTLIASVAENQPIGLHELAFSPAGTQLAIGGEGGTIHIVDPSTGRDLAPPNVARTTAYDGLAFSPDGRTLAAGSQTGIVAVFDTATDQLRNNLGGHTDAVNQVTYSPDGRYLASTSRDGTVIVWRTSDGSIVGKPFIGHSIGGEGSVSFTPDSRQVVSAAKSEVITWDIADRTALPGTGEKPITPTDVVVDAKRNLIISSGDDGRLHLWDSRTLQPVGFTPRLQTIVTDVTVDPADGLIAAGLSSGGTPSTPLPGGGIDLLTHGAQPRVIAHLDMSGIPQGMAFSPSGRQLAVATYDGALVVFDLTGTRRLAFQEQVDSFGGDSVGWTSDGSLIVYAGQGSFATVDVRTQKVSVQGQGPVTYVGILHPSSRDGTIAAGAYSGAVHLFRPDGTPSGRPSLPAPGPITDSIISPDGDLVAAAGADGTLSMWSLPDGTRLASGLPLTEGPNATLAFLDDHRIVVAGGNDSFDVVDLEPSVMVGQACSLVGRNLSRSEFSQYLGSEPYHKTCPQWPAGS